MTGAEIILNSELQQDSSIPLYQQLLGIIKQCIKDGSLKPGDMLPSEMELCDKYMISRSTIRQAFAALEGDGLIERCRGRGTFVTEPKLKRDLKNLYSFTAEMQMMGITPESDLLVFEKIMAPDDLCYRLKIEYGEMIYKIVRLRRANGEPLMLETVFIPEKKYPGLTRDIIAHSTLYKTLRENVGIIPKRATESYEVTTIDENEAKLLNTIPGSSAFFVRRTSEDMSGEIFELAIMLVRGDRCKYEVELKGTDLSMHRKIDETV
ncbi:MAG: GntR family transcriptional regulator [Christensenellaceae bacterium]|nr:GntR family transcriptional regulator [Christensenellaceae bacterium]